LESLPQKKSGSQKRAKLGSTLENFKSRSQISPERIQISKIRKTCDRHRFLPRTAKKAGELRSTNNKVGHVRLDPSKSTSSEDHIWPLGGAAPHFFTRAREWQRLASAHPARDNFYAPQLVPAGTAEARTSYGNSVRLSVRPSVTTRWYTKPRWDRDSGSSPHDSLESLVSNEVIWCHWVKRFPSNEVIKEEYPPLEIVILPLLAHLAWKRLQIDADLLRIIASTADELSDGTNIDDPEQPWTPKIGVFSEFLAILGCNTH